MIREWGARGLQVEELYGLDKDLLHDLCPIYGLIFLFKWDSQLETKRVKSISPLVEMGPEVYFAQQTVRDACATQALLSILLNVPPQPDVSLGDTLGNLKDFSRDLDPEMRGEAIGACAPIRAVHNSFGRPELVALQPKDEDAAGQEREDPFHFVSFLPIGDALYEFDGLKAGPICHGTFEGDKWSDLALQVIQDRIAAGHALGESAEIRFNLMALVKDRTLVYQERLDHNQRLIATLQAAPARSDEASPQQLASLQAQNVDLDLRLQEEQDKLARYRRENALRRSNLLPLALEVLQQMGQHGMLG